MKNLLKKFVQGIISPLGYRIADERNIHDEYGFARRIKAAGLSPNTIIDIGVAHGTPYLYESFPGAKFHLIDPTKESLPFMQKWAQKINAEIHNYGLGSRNQKMMMRLRDTIQHATFLKDLEAKISTTYEVPVKRFDSLDIMLAAPCLAKIDVEGFELEVLQGMTGKLDCFDIIIVETSLVSMYECGADAQDILNYMSSAGFRVVDIAGITRRPADSMIHQIDYVFARNGTRLAARRWN